MFLLQERFERFFSGGFPHYHHLFLLLLKCLTAFFIVFIYFLFISQMSITSHLGCCQTTKEKNTRKEEKKKKKHKSKIPRKRLPNIGAHKMQKNSLLYHRPLH